NSRSSSFRSPRKTTPRMVPPSTARPRDRNEERLYSEAGRRSLAGEESRAARLDVAKQGLVPGLDGRLLPRPRRLEALEGRGPAAGAARGERPRQHERQAHRDRGLGADDPVPAFGIDPAGAIRPTASSVATTARTVRRGRTRTTRRVTATGLSRANLLRPSASGRVFLVVRPGSPGHIGSQEEASW